eukprot:m.149033 g.149033  ORF g.149033 m.149033 type:complete len:63 (-) comp17337_c1_seq3:162-350(-)
MAVALGADHNERPLAVVANVSDSHGHYHAKAIQLGFVLVVSMSPSPSTSARHTALGYTLPSN